MLILRIVGQVCASASFALPSVTHAAISGSVWIQERACNMAGIPSFLTSVFLILVRVAVLIAPTLILLRRGRPRRHALLDHPQQCGERDAEQAERHNRHE